MRNEWVLLLPRFQGLPRQFEISRYLSVVAERDEIVFTIAHRMPQFMRPGPYSALQVRVRRDLRAASPCPFTHSMRSETRRFATRIDSAYPKCGENSRSLREPVVLRYIVYCLARARHCCRFGATERNADPSCCSRLELPRPERSAFTSAAGSQQPHWAAPASAGSS